MDIQDIYKPPEAQLEDHEPIPGSIRLAYSLILIFVFIGFLSGGLLIDFESEDYETEFISVAFYCGLSMLIGWLLYKPIRDKDKEAHKLPIYLLIILIGFILYEVVKGDYIIDTMRILELMELIIFIALIITVKSPTSRTWISKGSNKANQPDR